MISRNSEQNITIQEQLEEDTILKKKKTVLLLKAIVSGLINLPKTLKELGGSSEKKENIKVLKSVVSTSITFK